jgi:hypothetical protein
MRESRGFHQIGFKQKILVCNPMSSTDPKRMKNNFQIEDNWFLAWFRAFIGWAHKGAQKHSPQMKDDRDPETSKQH